MSLPTTYINDFYLEVVRGNVTGYSAKELLGLNAAVGGTEDVWNQGGSITHVSTAALLYISSSSAADITQTVTIVGLDANYDEITEDIVLNGSDGRTRVAGTKSFLRVNSVTLDIACAGKVYVYYFSAITAGVPDDLSKVQAAVDIAALQAYNAIYTVPRDKNWYLTALRYRSTGSTTTHNVILSIIQKLYGGANVTVETVKYTDGGTTYFDSQVQFTAQPVLFPAKSDIRIAAGLAGGTALDIALEASFIEEDIVAVPSTVTVLDKTAYLAKLTLLTRTLASQNYWLIGLDTVPASVPLTADLDNVLTTITGTTSYLVAASTDVVFDRSYFVSGKFIVTTKKAIFTIMRCVDSAGGIDYVQAPVNTIVDLGNVKKIQYLAA